MLSQKSTYFSAPLYFPREMQQTAGVQRSGNSALNPVPTVSRCSASTYHKSRLSEEIRVRDRVGVAELVAHVVWSVHSREKRLHRFPIANVRLNDASRRESVKTQTLNIPKNANVVRKEYLGGPLEAAMKVQSGICQKNVHSALKTPCRGHIPGGNRCK